MRRLLLSAAIVAIVAAPLAAAEKKAFSSAPPGWSTSRPLLTQQCGKKRYCKQMRNCREACYYFLKCGLSKLDRDKDGIPCENVCSQPCKRRG